MGSVQGLNVLRKMLGKVLKRSETVTFHILNSTEISIFEKYS